MRCKASILFVLLLFRYYSQSVPVIANNECATELPQNYAQWRLGGGTIQNLVTTLKHSACLNKKFSVIFYVVLDSTGLWGAGLTPSVLNTCITNLNNAFAPICVSFQQCTVITIPNFNFNKWRNDSTEIYVKQNFYSDKTINIYLAENIIYTPPPSPPPIVLAGYTYMPPVGALEDLIVIKKSEILNTAPIHEMGHFFGLPHTFEEIGPAVIPPHPPNMLSYEFVARTNCYTNGDGFCDTEADCYPLPNGTQDGNNKFYLRPTDNFMSYYSSSCRFTQEQYNFMAATIVSQRLYLH